jgi:hypothetical protein
MVKWGGGGGGGELLQNFATKGFYTDDREMGRYFGALKRSRICGSEKFELVEVRATIA